MADTDDASAPKRGGPRRPARWLRRLFLVALGIVVVLVIAGVAIAGSGSGQRLVLDRLVESARGVFRGPVTVGDIRSSTLLEGATLVGVRIEAEGGRPFLSLDSVRVHYSLLSFLTGRPQLTSLVLWGPHIVVTRYPGEQNDNVSRLLRESGPVTDSTRVTREIAVNRIAIRHGLVEVLTPLSADASSRFLRVPAPGGRGQLRRIAVDSLDLDLQDVLVRLGSPEPFRGTVTSVSADAHLFQRPVRVTDARGSISYGVGGIDLRNATVRLPGTTLEGELRLGPEAGEGSSWAFAANVKTRGRGRLGDFQWIDPRIPDGSFEGGVTVTAGTDLDARFHDLRVELEASELFMDGGVTLGDHVRLRDLTVGASPLLASRLEPWIGREMPVQGWLRGTLTVSGTPEALSTTGRMTFVPVDFGGLPSTADVKGVLHGGSDPGFTDFEARVDPLNMGLLALLSSRLDIPGTGRATMSLSGRVAEGVRVALDVTQGPDSTSRVTAHGTVQRLDGNRWSTDLQTRLAPVSLALLSRVRPDLRLGGAVSGSLRAVGPIDSLHVTGDLRGGGGHIGLDGIVDARMPGSRYNLDARLADVRMSELVRRLPSPTAWSGRIHLDGSGLSRDSMQAVATVAVGGSRVGGLRIDTIAARMTASRGMLGIDTLVADLGGVHLAGGGQLGMTAGREGSARFRFTSDSLIGLRSLFMGDTVVARDTLSVLEKELLRFQGVNPDALPDSAQVAMAGTLQGETNLAGSLDSLDIGATLRLRSGVYRLNRVDSATVEVDARGYRTPRARVRFTVNADGVRTFDRRFEAVHVTADVAGGRGEGSLAIRRRPGEVYSATGSFAVDSAGGSLDLKEASATFDSLAWQMVRPTRIVWDSSSVTVDSLHVRRAGTRPMSVVATGTLSRVGDSNFRLDASGVQLARVTRFAQLESLDLGGRLDLRLRVTGAARTPLIDGSFDLADGQYGDMKLSRIGGTLAYSQERARVQLDAWDSAGAQVLTAGGTVPVDLALSHVADRTPPVPMNFHVRADSLDAAVALSYLTMLQNVRGTVSGDFRVGGTLDKPEPSGSLELQNAAWSIEAIGVRHTRINGKLTLHPDRTVDVELASRAVGTSEVTGRIVLEPLSNPKLDLKIHFAGFQAVDRRDLAGRISGDLTLDSTYNRPEVGGKLTVDQGTLYLEEFARSAEVVDLTAPDVFNPDVFNVVDTTVLSSRPILADLRNPFLEHLRVSVDLSVPRDTWLRSPDMNVEIGGELIVTYDRLKRDMVLVGELNALRGSYTVLGRRFDVQTGTVGFAGVPGINPTLDIQAVSRVRRVGNEPLAVTATVSGTLTQPRVSFSTDEQGVPQSDLVSYLVFGRPAHELSTGQNALVQGATGAGVTYLAGLAATRIGAAVAQQIGVDYLSISQAADFQASNVGILPATLANTQVEIGQYLSQNVYVVLVLRKPAEGASTAGWLGGARVDWALSDNYNAQGFVEDRYLRSQTPGFVAPGQNSQILGVFIYREWGY